MSTTSEDLEQMVLNIEKITSKFLPNPPSHRQSDDDDFPLKMKDIDQFASMLMNSQFNFTSDKINKSICNIYTKLRDSAFIDNYLYLYFSPSTHVQGIIGGFYRTIYTVLWDIISSKEERIEFIEKIKERVKRVQFLRDIATTNNYRITTSDIARYGDISVLNTSIIKNLDLNMLYVNRGEGDHDSYIYPDGTIIPKLEGGGGGWSNLEDIPNWY